MKNRESPNVLVVETTDKPGSSKASFDSTVLILDQVANFGPFSRWVLNEKKSATIKFNFT